MANLGNKIANIGKRAYANKRKKKGIAERGLWYIGQHFIVYNSLATSTRKSAKQILFQPLSFIWHPPFFITTALLFFLFTALLFSIPPFIGILSKVLYYHKIKLPGIYFPARNKVIIMPGWGFYPFFSLARAPCFTPCVIVRDFFLFSIPIAEGS